MMTSETRIGVCIATWLYNRAGVKTISNERSKMIIIIGPGYVCRTRQ